MTDLTDHHLTPILPDWDMLRGALSSCESAPLEHPVLVAADELGDLHRASHHDLEDEPRPDPSRHHHIRAIDNWVSQNLPSARIEVGYLVDALAHAVATVEREGGDLTRAATAWSELAASLEIRPDRYLGTAGRAHQQCGSNHLSVAQAG